MHRLVAILLLTLCAMSAHASMVFYAIAVPADQAKALVLDQQRLFSMLDRKRPDVLDLEKAWHAMHYLLTGSTEEPVGVLGQAILGGTETGEDAGYGPARVLSALQVKQIAAALAPLTSESLAGRYDPVTMERLRIYPSVWSREGVDALHWVQGYFPALQAFYRKAAESGSAVVLVIV